MSCHRERSRRRALVGEGLLAATLVACGQSTASDVTSVSVPAGAPSEVVRFDIPPAARGITVIVDGDQAASFALASMTVAGSAELVEPAIASSLTENLIGSGAQMQFPRRRTFTFQYPVLASQPLEGQLALRVVSDRPGVVSVRVLAPTGPAHILHVALVSFSNDTPLDVEPEAVEHAREILARVGIDLVVDEQIFVEAYQQMAVTNTVVTPGDEFYGLFERAHAAVTSDALPVVFVDLPDYRTGFSAGIPCPLLAEHPYLAVAIDPNQNGLSEGGARAVGRTLAHELGHALGLHHPENVLRSEFDPENGWHVELVYDAFDDTNGPNFGLMGGRVLDAPVSEEAVFLSPQQVFAMTRSALLE